MVCPILCQVFFLKVPALFQTVFWQHLSRHVTNHLEHQVLKMHLFQILRETCPSSSPEIYIYGPIAQNHIGSHWFSLFNYVPQIKYTYGTIRHSPMLTWKETLEELNNPTTLHLNKEPWVKYIWKMGKICTKAFKPKFLWWGQTLPNHYQPQPA